MSTASCSPTPGSEGRSPRANGDFQPVPRRRAPSFGPAGKDGAGRLASVAVEVVAVLGEAPSIAPPSSPAIGKSLSDRWACLRPSMTRIIP